MSNLGEFFRQLRLSKNWSLREAARRMGLSYSYLSILEKGLDPKSGKETIPKPETLRAISKAYEYPYEDLLKAVGHLEDDYFSSLPFDLSIFTGNLNLVKGDMTIEELSKDIFEKTGYNISPGQIRSYLNGDIEPFPGTINILCKYAQVTPRFWYVFNSKETLEQERKKYRESAAVRSTSGRFSKDFAVFTAMKEDIREWVTKEENMPYLRLAMEARKKEIDVNSLKAFIDSMPPSSEDSKKDK